MRDGGPAFPEISGLRMRQGDKETESIRCYSGMTLRDYFAAKAIPALIELESDCDYAGLAHDAYIMADAMLEAREK